MGSRSHCISSRKGPANARRGSTCSDEYSESDLEEALIQRLTDFLLELGDDFAFLGRQRRLWDDRHKHLEYSPGPQVDFREVLVSALTSTSRGTICTGGKSPVLREATGGRAQSTDHNL
jgi:hypothetical protein